MKLTRDFYRPKEGYVEYKPELGDCIGYKKGMFEIWVNFEKLTACFFKGKKAKPEWHYRFKDTEAIKKKINETINCLLKWETLKEERKEERKKEILDVKVGDLFVSSWGYEQTNANFFQVVGITKKGIKVRPIKSKENVDSKSMTGTAIPIKNAFEGEAITKKIYIDNYGNEGFSMGKGYAGAEKWDGKPVWISTYG